MKEQITIRQSKTAAVYDCLHSQMNQWIGVHEFAHVGGFAAWRTRVSDARALAERDGCVIEWNDDPQDSRYRCRRQPLGRDASMPTPTANRTLFDMYQRP